MKCLQIAIIYVLHGIVNGGEESVSEERQLAIASEDNDSVKEYSDVNHQQFIAYKENESSKESPSVKIELVVTSKENNSPEEGRIDEHQLAINSKEITNVKNELTIPFENDSESTSAERQLTDTSKENERSEESTSENNSTKTNSRPDKRCGIKNKYIKEPNSCASSSQETFPFRYTFKFTSTTKAPILPRGPFYDFVVNICQTLLTRFSKRKIPGYFAMLRKTLQSLDIEYSVKRMLDKFEKKLKKNSQYNGKVLKVKVKDFLKMISSGDPVINEFFYAMNAIYTTVDDMKLDDYIYRLKRYGGGEIKHIGEKTRQVFRWIIFHRLYHVDEKVMDNIQIKFLSAAVDYIEKNKGHF